MFTIIIFIIIIRGIITDSMLLIFIVFHIAIKQFIFCFEKLLSSSELLSFTNLSI